MISDKMMTYVKTSSVIRAMFEEGKRLAEIYGAENVYDYSLGNPSVEPPARIKEALIDVLNEENPNKVHGYMNNSGYEDVRERIALSINEKHGTNYNASNIVMTVGAAGGLNVILKSLLNPGDEVITFAPYFGEYRNYVSNYDGILVATPPNTEDFQPNLAEFEKRITRKTKAVIINSLIIPQAWFIRRKRLLNWQRFWIGSRLNIIYPSISFPMSPIENWYMMMWRCPI